MAYGKSRNAKKTGVGPFILELFTKNEKIGKKMHFFNDFFYIEKCQYLGIGNR